MIDSAYASGRAGLASEPIGAPRLVGTTSDDILRGTRGNDSLDASQGGDDIVVSRGGDDTIYFGGALTSSDRIYDRKGDHDILVLQGDYSAGLQLDDSFINGIETVRLLTGGSYTITGDFSFQDSSLGAIFDARALSTTEFLHLDGSLSSGSVSADGGAGGDILVGGDVGYASFGGGAGDDVLISRNGGGLLYGDLDADTMTSGEGRTNFNYGSELESTQSAPDLLIGYDNHDRFFFYVDADKTQDGYQTFHFGATSGHIGDLTVHYNKTQDLTIVRAYTDGDSKADMEIHLQGHVPLTPADFGL